MCPSYLLVRKLLGLFIYIPLVQVGSEGHQPHLGETEVSEFNVAEGCDQEIVRFEVPMDNTKGVEILDRKDSLSKIESGIKVYSTLLR